MNKLRICLLTLFLGSCAQVWGAPNNLPLPAGLYSIDDLISEFRNPLKTKIEDLKKNYRARASNNLVEYSSHESVDCLFQKWEPDTLLSKIEYFFRKEGPEAVDVLRYSGCGDNLTLVERLLTVGGEQKPLSFEEFSRGKLDFNLKKDQERFYYQLQNNRGENLFSLAARWTDESKVSALYSFSMRDQEFLLARYNYFPHETRITYTFKGFNIAYQYLPWFNLKVEQNHYTFTFKVLVKKDNPQVPQFLSSRGTLLSQNTFNQYFSFWAIKNGLANVKKFVDFHLYWFPPTQFVTTGGQSQRLINELRLNLNRILNNSNINLVEVYLRNLIDSVENGLIIDRRPAE